MTTVRKLLALALCLFMITSSFPSVSAQDAPSPSAAMEEAATPAPAAQEETPAPTLEVFTTAPVAQESTPPAAQEATPAPETQAPFYTPAPEEPAYTPIVTEAAHTPIMEDPTPTPFASAAPAPGPDAASTPEASQTPVLTVIDYTADASRSPDFSCGYAVLLGNADVYETAQSQDSMGTVSNGVVYALARSAANADMLQIAFAVRDTGVLTGYVRARALRPMSPEEIGAYLALAGTGEYSYQGSIPLGAAAYKPAAAMETETPTAAPQLSPAPDAGEADEGLGMIDPSPQMRDLGLAQITASYTNNAYFSFTFSGGKATIGGYSGPDMVVNISPEVNGYPITEIGGQAFRYTNVQSVTIPYSVTSVAHEAFYNCKNLQSVNLPSGITAIYRDTFFGCSSLTNVNLPSGVKSIGQNAFSGCTSLTSITLPDGLLTIGASAFNECTSLAGINIPHGVQRIEAMTFSGCENLLSAVLPNNLTYIGSYAFAYCERLEGIDIPYGVLSIADSAFEYCRSLSWVSLASSLESIGDSAFAYCYGLTNVTLPHSVTSIGEEVFNNCINLELIGTSPGNPAYATVDGVLYNKAMTVLKAYPANKSSSSFVIPDGVTTIDQRALSMSENLSDVVIPGSCTTIGDWAFTGSGITGITIPNSISALSYGMLFHCRRLTSVKLPYGLLSIGDYAFSECANLRSITIPYSVNAIGAQTFSISGITNLSGYAGTYAQSYAQGRGLGFEALPFQEIETISLSSQTLTLGLSNSAALTASILPADATIPEYTWQSSEPSVATVSDSGLVTAHQVGNATITAQAIDGSGVIASCEVTVIQPVTQIIIQVSSTNLYKGNMLALEAAVLPVDATTPSLVWSSDDESVAVVNPVGFITATGPGIATIKATSQDGSGVFGTCTVYVTDMQLTHEDVTLYTGDTQPVSAVLLPANTQADNLLWTSSNESVATVDENGLVTAIKAGTATVTAAQDASGLSDTCAVTVLQHVTGIELTNRSTIATGGSTMLYAEITPSDASNKAVVWTSSDESIVTVDSEGMVKAMHSGTAVIRASAQDGSAVYGECTFTVVDFAYYVNVSDATIDGYYGSDSHLVIPEYINGYHVIGISDLGGHDFVSVEIPDSVVTIGFEAFYNCPNLTTVTLPQGVTTIGYGAFAGCTSLQSIVIPSGVKVIGYGAFSGCTQLSQVSLPPALERIAGGAFKNCTSLAGIVIPATVTQINDEAFMGCESLASISLPNGVTTLGASVFEGCTSLQQVNIPLGIASAGSYLFKDCTSLSGVVIPANITSISIGMFEKCTSLEDIVIPAWITGIGSNAFYRCYSLQSVTLPSGLTSIGAAAMSGCTALDSIYVPPSVTSIGMGAFPYTPQFILSGYEGSYVQTYAAPNEYAFIALKYVAGITLDRTSMTLVAGEAVKISAAISPSDAAVKDLLWTSSNSSVAAVDDQGNVTAKAKGIATIAASAKDGSGKSASCTVKVNQPVTVQLNRTDVTMPTDESFHLTAAVSPNDVLIDSVTWKSSNAAAAAVDDSGMVTALSAGTASITATVNERFTAVCTITVENACQSVSLDKTHITMMLGQIDALMMSTDPADAYVSSKAYASSNTAVALVSDNGVIMAAGPGEATITLTVNNSLSAQCAVTVKRPYIALGSTDLIIAAGQSIDTLNVVVMGSLFELPITYLSADTSIATVDANGIIYGVTQGATVITVSTLYGITAGVNVQVVKAGKGVVGVSISKESAAMDEGKTVSLSARLSPSSAQDKEVVWTSSDPTIASVDGKGKVYGHAPGTAIITATASSGVSDQCTVTVNSLAVSQVIVSKGYLEADEGKTASLSASVLPRNARIKTVTWSSSDPAVASVSPKGKITALMPGTVTITATAHNGVAASCTFVVRSLGVSQVMISKDYLEVDEGKTASLSASVLPRNARFKTVTWSVSDPAVAAVSSKGKITAYAPGTVTVTATAHNGVVGTCTLVVRSLAVSALGMNKYAITLQSGKSDTLKVSISPKNARFKTVTWSSSNPAVAAVSTKGKITATGHGTAVITATAHNGVSVSCTVTVP